MPEIIFEFSSEVIPIIIKEIELAKDYVKIAMFQIHHEEVFNVLEKKAKEGLHIEILTLPYDSIDDKIRPEVEARFEKLRKENVSLYFNKWNVGDPGRTTTAVNRWYSFHGKFIVTDRSAIALSANFTQESELESVIIFRDYQERIDEFKAKYNELLDYFVKRDDSYDGSIHKKITSAKGGENPKIFELPESADTRHKDHWIQHYPASLCPSNVVPEEKLYLTPFDFRGRDFIASLVQSAKEYVYISTESFTDEEFSILLSDISMNKGIQVRILTGTKSMDFSDRVDSMLKELLARQVDVRTTDGDLHAKLIITDTVLMVSSINLNNINLGFNVTKQYWRENTETAFVYKNPELVQVAKRKFLQVFNASYSVADKLSEKLQDLVTNMFIGTFGLRSTQETKVLFARFILKKQLDVRKLIVRIGSITKKLMESWKRNTVGKEDFLCALVLYYLSERKQDYDQLTERFDEIDESASLRAVISRLELARLIEREEGYFKINVNALSL